MKDLLAALQKAVPGISEDSLSSIHTILESAIEKKANEKVSDLTDVIDKYVDTVGSSIVESIKDDIEDDLNAKSDAVREEVETELKEAFDEKMDLLVEGLDKVTAHAAEVYIDENEKALIDEAIVTQADSITKLVGDTMLALGGGVIDIQEGKENNSSVVESAINAKNEAIASTLIAENKLALVEAAIDLDVATRSKLTKVMEAELQLPATDFNEKLGTMKDIIGSKRDERREGRRSMDESYTPRSNKTKRKILR